MATTRCLTFRESTRKFTSPISNQIKPILTRVRSNIFLRFAKRTALEVIQRYYFYNYLIYVHSINITCALYVKSREEERAQLFSAAHRKRNTRRINSRATFRVLSLVYCFRGLYLRRINGSYREPGRLQTKSTMLFPEMKTYRAAIRDADVSVILVCRCRETRNEEERLSTAENSIWKSDPVLRISASIYQSRKDHAPVMDTADSTWTPYRVANRNQKPYQPPGLIERRFAVTEGSLFPHVGFLI